MKAKLAVQYRDRKRPPRYREGLCKKRGSNPPWFPYAGKKSVGQFSFKPGDVLDFYIRITPFIRALSSLSGSAFSGGSNKRPRRAVCR